MLRKIKKLIALYKNTPAILVDSDEKAVFFSEGTVEEFLEQERKDNGLQPWYERLKNL